MLQSVRRGQVGHQSVSVSNRLEAVERGANAPHGNQDVARLLVAQDVLADFLGQDTGAVVSRHRLDSGSDTDGNLTDRDGVGDLAGVEGVIDMRSQLLPKVEQGELRESAPERWPAVQMSTVG